MDPRNVTLRSAAVQTTNEEPEEQTGLDSPSACETCAAGRCEVEGGFFVTYLLGFLGSLPLHMTRKSASKQSREANIIGIDSWECTASRQSHGAPGKSMVFPRKHTIQRFAASPPMM